MASQDESFPLESNQSNESQDNQRTSTPTKDFTHSQSDITEQFLAASNEALSPVQKTLVTAIYQDSSQLHDSVLSTETEEDSPSVYNSALSNVDLTVTSDSYVTVQEAVDSKVSSGSYVTLNSEGVVAPSPFDISLAQEMCLQNKTLVEHSTENGMWNTAVESIQDSSDLKDKTIGQELSVSNVSSNVGCTSFSTNGDRRESDEEIIISTAENKRDPQHILDNGLIQYNAKNPDSIPMEGHSPDLELLNEICEEATNMTIKEALISSLDPGVRAGLREGRLSLNESEILALEQYCEKFIDNLLSQLLDVSWSNRISEEEHKAQKVKDKTIMTQKLSRVGLEKLKSNCDRFVHSIITESLHDTCYGFLNDKELIRDIRDLSSTENESVQLNEDNFEALLPLFKESKAIQDYVGFLSADVIKSALTNLSTSIATLNGEKNEEVTMNEITVLDNNTEENQFHDSGMWKYQGDSANGSQDDKTCVKLMTVDTNVRDKGGLSDVDDGLFSSSLPGALETSLEYDTGEWEGDGLFGEFCSLDADRKQKIMLRELSFDDHADVAGTELLAPVFLAIAEENDEDTEIQGMRKKTLSIEDLCGVINEPGKEKSRPRSQSAAGRLLKEEHDTCESNFILEEDSSERYSDSEEEYEGDEEEVDDDDMDSGDSTIEQEGEIYGDNEQGHLHEKMISEVNADSRFRWHTVSVNGREKVLDLKLLEPYMKVISHGGYFSDTRSTIIVIAACYLPDRGLSNYDYLMEQLFFYIISTMELLAVHEEYYLVYLNGGTRQHNMPYVAWMKRFYQLIEGGLKKRMKEMFIVHANFRLKVIITLAKPFLNAVFWRKLIFVHSLGSLSSRIPVDYIYIPDEVMKVDPAYRLVHNGGL